MMHNRMKRKQSSNHWWRVLSDEKLLDLRLCDLGLHIADSEIQPSVEQLYRELLSHGITWRPHVWLSNEWFSSDGIPGFAIPFYLAHPRLRKLEKSQMYEVEGGTHDWSLRLMRHECGHAIDNAYRLNLKRRYRSLFGNYSNPYPDSYHPKPYTKQFVVHLDMWYAQAHPAEDFAETFAVWLNPDSHWLSTYRNWPAIAKLKWVGETLHHIGHRRAPVRNHRVKRELRTLRMTLRQHYEQKRKYYYRDHPGFYDRDLRRMFSNDPEFSKNPAAPAFIQQVSEECRLLVSRWTGESQLILNYTLADIIHRSRRLKLRLRKSETETKIDLMMMLAVQTMNYLNDGKHRVVI